MWFGCWSRVIPSSHLPWTKGDVVEDETWHCQMSDTGNWLLWQSQAEFCKFTSGVNHKLYEMLIDIID